MVQCSVVLVFDKVSSGHMGQYLSKGILDGCRVSLSLSIIWRFKCSATAFSSGLWGVVGSRATARWQNKYNMVLVRNVLALSHLRGAAGSPKCLTILAAASCRYYFASALVRSR